MHVLTWTREDAVSCCVGTGKQTRVLYKSCLIFLALSLLSSPSQLISLMSKMTLGFEVKRCIGVPVVELFLVSGLAIVLLSTISREQTGLTQEEGSHTKQFSPNELSFQAQMHQMHRAWRILFSEWDIVKLHFILRTLKVLGTVNEWMSEWMGEWMNKCKNLWGHVMVNRASMNRLVTSLFCSSWRQAFCWCSFYFFRRNPRCCLLHPLLSAVFSYLFSLVILTATEISPSCVAQGFIVPGLRAITF